MKKAYFYSLLSVLLWGCSDRKSPVDYVDPFIGTGFHGHTYPGATAPFGAVQLSPDTRTGDWDACSGYHYSDSTIIGFSHTHLSGTGCADLGDILFHPTTNDIEADAEALKYTPLYFSHADETASPGYYSVDFKKDGIKAELTATTYAGVHRYTFSKGKNVSVIIDLAHLLADEVIDSVTLRLIGKNEVSGMRRTQGWVSNQYVFFVARFSRDFESADFVKWPKSQNNYQAVLRFGISDGEPILAKVGISIVSEENARLNLDNDTGALGFDFDAIRRETTAVWEKALSDIVVEGGSDADMRNFYTAQYHAKIVPNIVSDVNGEYRKHDMSIGTTDGKRKAYSTFSLWDTFRAWHPLVTLLDTVFVSDMVNSLMDMYRTTGELPLWPLSAGETRTMIGYHSVSVIADAYMKGISGFDAQEVLEAMKRSSDINKKGSDYYLKYGFIPADIKKESVSCLLEFAYDDWCIAMMAKKLGKEDDYKQYTERALFYVNVFDGYTKFFRGKRLDGNWETPFNPFEPARDYTEATAWQYRFFAPHDINGLVQLFGGEELLAAEVDSLFTVSSKIEGKMVDITGLIGQYAQGNEPSHHMAYLYNYVGQPWKTQAMTRRILKEMYQPLPEGISGNEDCGQMSAWYILSSLGFYSVCPGTNEFVLTSPLFEKATIRLANGKELRITANDPKKNTYIDKVFLNGEEIVANFILYDDLMKGGELVFHLTDKPNLKRGTNKVDYPYSLTTENTASIPYTRKDLFLFIDEVDVDLGSATPGCEIRYTLDASEPTMTSALYANPIKLDKSAAIKAKAFKEGYVPSRTFAIQAVKAKFADPVKSSGEENGVKYVYYEGRFKSVSDLLKSVPKSAGTMDEPTIANAGSEDHFGYLFEGFISVPVDGVYQFATKSDDGSVLYINGEKVVNNDGSHAAISATGRVALKKGLHPFRLLYFEDYEGQHFEWGWKVPGSDQWEKIPASALFVK